jgi:hypothetical protein
MTKKIMSDIVVNKRSIREITVSKEKAPIQRKPAKVNWQRKPLNPKLAIWSIALICIVALFFGVSIIFSSATVVVSPKIEKVTFADEVYMAKLASKTEDNLIFETINTTKIQSETIEAGEEQEVNQKASGKIIVYNNFNTSDQRLINNTRFESTDGRIYRINSSVVVPGIKKVAGKSVPGSIEVTVYADQAGESYNLKLADLKGDFKIPGFKGDPRYDGFSARLKEDIKGGFIGKQRVVSAELRASTLNSLKEKLREQLLKEIYMIKPEKYLLFTDHYSFHYSELPDTSLDNNKVKIEMEGTTYALVFDSQKIAKFISQKKGLNLEGLKTEFIPSEDFTVTIMSLEDISLMTEQSISLKFNGEGTIKWLYDLVELKKDLAGKKEADLKSVMLNYSNSIANIDVIFRPVWTRYIPDNSEKIKVRENKI